MTFNQIIATVARHYKMTPDDLLSYNRLRRTVRARQIAMFICREETGATLHSIGLEFGGRDHTTVMHAIDTMKIKLVRPDPGYDYRADLEAIRRKLCETRLTPVLSNPTTRIMENGTRSASRYGHSFVCRFLY